MFTNVINVIHVPIGASDMVKRGGKEVVTVEIFKDTYDTMKSTAEKMRWNTKEYINSVLAEALGARQVPPDIPALPLKGRVPGKHTLYPRREKEQDGRGLSQRQGALLVGCVSQRIASTYTTPSCSPEVAKMFLKRPR